MICSLGLEFSTQSLKILILDIETGTVLFTKHVIFDIAFPHYHTQGGVLYHQDTSVRHTSPLLHVEALEHALQCTAETPWASAIQVIKIDAQQHCSVYARKELSSLSLNDNTNLVTQLERVLTRSTSPIWEDSSTKTHVKQLETALKGNAVHLTGNPIEARFPAVQILKWAAQDTESYNRTQYIMLLSAFLTSILIGKPAPVDTGDGWGTNLNSTNIQNPSWNKSVLNAIQDLLPAHSSSLQEKLGSMAPYDTPLTPIHPYFVKRFGIPAKAMVLCGTGDNPAALLGSGGQAVISLGSSYTINGTMHTPAFSSTYNTFGYTNTVMALSVITNGAKLHDIFRKQYNIQDWAFYINTAGSRMVTAEEPIMLPYHLAESMPAAPPGIHRQGFTEENAAANIRALHISQVLSLKIHAAHIGSPKNLVLVGGAAHNTLLHSMLADAFGIPVYMLTNADMAPPLGCAVSGAQYLTKENYTEIAQRFTTLQLIAEPVAKNAHCFQRLAERYHNLEQTRAYRL